MSGWDDWANNVRNSGAADEAALYCPNTGSIWGKTSAAFDGVQLKSFDMKAEGKDCSAEFGGKRFMFIRKTLDDEPSSIFKSGQSSMFTMRGPNGCRVAVYIKEKKPEPIVAAVSNYLVPHIS